MLKKLVFVCLFVAVLAFPRQEDKPPTQEAAFAVRGGKPSPPRDQPVGLERRALRTARSPQGGGLDSMVGAGMGAMGAASEMGAQAIGVGMDMAKNGMQTMAKLPGAMANSMGGAMQG